MRLLTWFCLIVLVCSCDSESIKTPVVENNINDKSVFDSLYSTPPNGLMELKRVDSLLARSPGDCDLVQMRINLLLYNEMYNICLDYLDDNQQCLDKYDELYFKVGCSFEVNDVRLFDSLKFELSELASGRFNEEPGEVSLIDYLIVLKMFGNEEEMEQILENNMHLIKKGGIWYREDTKTSFVQDYLADIDVLEMP